MPVVRAKRSAAATTPPSADRAAGARRDAPLGRRILRILRHTIEAFIEDRAMRLGAALAFYTTVAIAPMLVLAIAFAGYVFDDGARDHVLGEIERLAGHQAGAAINAVENPANNASGFWTTAFGVVMLFVGAFGVFQHLQDALNSVWRVHVSPTQGWHVFLKQRLFSMATVLITGFLLMVSLIASAALSWIGATTVERLGLPVIVLEIVNNTLSFLVITLLFALIFKLLPDTRIRWRQVWLGSVVTAALFTVGKSALGFYLGRAGVTSAYGAAGSLMVLLLWCYYAGQIVFLGAEFTRVTALSNGGRDFSRLARSEPRTV